MLGLLYEVTECYFLAATWASRTSDVRERYSARGLRFATPTYLYYEAYSESKYRFAVKKSSKVSYKILLLSDSTFFKLFSHIFAAIIEAQIFVYSPHRMRPPATQITTDNVME